ncbi:hypothetical protein P9134_23090, partial [Bacillus cereus]|nr:hypothetical protein [Bacillus cereus]
MKVFKKLVPTALSLFIISSSYSAAQAETDSFEDNKGKNANFSVLTEVQNNRSSKSLLRPSYDLDDVISYPKDYTNVSRSLEFEDNTKWPLFVRNRPEMINRQGSLAYSTEVNRTGKFRIYWAHQNYN